MITVGLKNKALEKLAKAARESGRKLPREIATVLNKTATKTKTQMSREVRKELAAPAKAVNKTITKPRKADPKRLLSSAAINKSKRIPLKEFKARHTKRGVGYKISKRGGRRTIPDAFMGPRPGAIAVKLRGHVFRRLQKGRKPIIKLYGPSPYGVFRKHSMVHEVTRNIAPVLKNEMERRIKFNVLKASGAI